MPYLGTRLVGFILLGAALLIVAGVIFLNSNKSDTTLIFSPLQVLSVTWERYKANYLEEGTLRALDRQRNNITTSEGQSYTLLRSVWLGDKPTFDTAWQWTKDNLQHEESDRLISWLFGQQADGTFGVLEEQGGDHTASDADQDIALALIFAFARWQDPNYLGDARVLLNDIWEKEVVTVQGVPYMSGGDQEKTSPAPYALINPSYLSPAWYRIFAKVDPDHPWERLAGSSYDILERSRSDTGLPPDWIALNKTTGELSPAPQESLKTNFGFDAMRVPWRIALDAQWFNEERAQEYLRSLTFLSEEWEQNQKLSSTYGSDGSAVTADETAAMYGGTIGYFMIADPEAAKEIYEDKLIYLYDPGKNDWKERLSYYDENWAWFGIGLYNNLLLNLTEGLPDSAYHV